MTNWKSQVIQFEMGENTVTLVGDLSLVRAKISLKAMLRTIRKEKGGIWVEINEMEGMAEEQKIDPQIPGYIAPILQKYKGVFAESTGLPPPRGNEHAILLKEGTNPVGVRPYRYP